jgi:sugar lactone lactonase YvrE
MQGYYIKALMSITARCIADGIYFGEGPRWHDGQLWFSDFYAHEVRSLDASGHLKTELTLDDQPSGLGWLPDGQLLVVAMAALKVMRLDADGLHVHADLSHIAKHRANDMVVDARGRAYVGNFGFDLDAEIHQRGIQAVVESHPSTALARVDSDGSVHIAATGLHFPNGMAITSDGRTLIVAETLSACLTAFDIDAHGQLSNRRVWAPLGPRAPDGICLDADGNVWVANALAPECALIAPGGAELARVETGDHCYACMLGGDNGRTLYMMTAPSANAAIAAQAPKGRLLAANVSTGRAGWP